METLLAFLTGGMMAAAVYLMLQRHLVNFVLGLVLINHAVNLLVLASGRLTRGRPALIPEGLDAPPEAIANALPQALILTAVVIGFGLLAFVLVLAWRTFTELGTIDAEEMRLAEPRLDEALVKPPGERRKAA